MDVEETGYRGSSENTQIISSICKRHHIMKLGAADYQRMSILPNIQILPEHILE